MGSCRSTSRDARANQKIPTYAWNTMAVLTDAARSDLVRRAFRLEWLTVAWMAVEAAVAIGAGISAHRLWCGQPDRACVRGGAALALDDRNPRRSRVLGSYRAPCEQDGWCAPVHSRRIRNCYCRLRSVAARRAGVLWAGFWRFRSCSCLRRPKSELPTRSAAERSAPMP
jgi:hypothetical protein